MELTTLNMRKLHNENFSQILRLLIRKLINKNTICSKRKMDYLNPTRQNFLCENKIVLHIKDLEMSILTDK